MVNDVDDVVAEFLVESYENLDRLDQDLVRLEDDPKQHGTLASVFRTIHTIKGTCGFLGYTKLEGVTHVGENLLSRLRDGTLELDGDKMSALLAMVDAVREMLRSIESNGTDGDNEYGELRELLTSLLSNDRPAAPVAEAAPVEAEAPKRATRSRSKKKPAEASVTPSDPDPEADARPMGVLLVEEGVVTPDQVSIALAEQSLGDGRMLGQILVDHGVAASDAVEEVARRQGDAKPSLAESTIRVDVDVLDRLMNLVGELVLARNNILQHLGGSAEQAIMAASQRLDLVTGELQESVMKTRMQPIGSVWSKFPRVVRDLAHACDKQVRMETEGEGTELDKTIIEAIKDPLTHVVRNAVDHGIEMPDVRVAAGKPAEGTLRMRAHHEGGQVIVEISDDGAGIDVPRVKAKALERGLVTQSQADAMSDREAMHLIFLPGFSTAKAVTNVSGRGVGMDVVKTNVEKIGGTVEVMSELGRGTTLRVKIPLTLAIVPALLVNCDGDRYAIPQREVLELVRVDGERARTAVEQLHDTPVYRLRGNLLPLVYLRAMMGMQPNPHTEALTIAVLSADGQQFGLVVDGVVATEEIVVKPLGRMLRSVPVFSGATIMGDGRVALILDVAGIARITAVVTNSNADGATTRSESAAEVDAERVPLLIVATGGDSRVAIPLADVARLEEIPVDTVEHTRGRDVVQYRGDILPLVRVSELVGSYGEGEIGDNITVVVHAWRGRQIGIIVDRIVDIVDTKVPKERDQVTTTLVVADRVTELLDVGQVLAGVVGSLFDDLVEVNA